MKRKLSKSIVALALAAGVIGAVAPAASANTTPGCVTRTEFRRVRMGMTVQRVRNIYGTNGRLSLQSGGYTIRDYRTCARFHVTNVSYQNGRVIGKLFV